MRLESIIGTRSRILLLRHLCSAPSKDFSIAELADEIGIHKSLVSRIVKDLKNQRIVLTRDRRNLKLCQINQSTEVYRMLATVFASERKLNG
jgi:DNA-binding MarR family transcriptional regulator